jgi:hypothetical protein
MHPHQGREYTWLEVNDVAAICAGHAIAKAALHTPEG